MRVAIDGQGYASAVEAFASGSRLAVSVGETLAGRLQGYAGMAGDDTTSAEFAASYDEAAAECVAAVGELAPALASLAGLAAESLVNHPRADARSVLDGGVDRSRESVPSPDADLDRRLPTPPSSLGGDPPSLPGAVNWVLDQLEGVVWPNADTDRLRDAATTWRETARSVGLLTAHCDTALLGFDGELSPEIPLAVATTQDLRQAIGQLADQLGSLGTACEEYAAHVDAKRAEMLDLLESLAAELAVGTIILGGLTVLSAGLAAPAAGAASAGRLAWAAAELRGIVEALRLAAGGTAVALRPVTVTVQDSRAYLSRLIASRRSAMTERGTFHLGAYSGRRPGWLDQHEAAGGHVKARHVGKSDEELLERLATDPTISASSSFVDQRAAERAIGDLLERQHARLDAWLAGSGRTLKLEDELGYATGRTAERTGDVFDVTGIRALLVRDPALPEGFRIHTAFPQP